MSTHNSIPLSLFRNYRGMGVKLTPTGATSPLGPSRPKTAPPMVRLLLDYTIFGVPTDGLLDALCPLSTAKEVVDTYADLFGVSLSAERLREAMVGLPINDTDTVIFRDANNSSLLGIRIKNPNAASLVFACLDFTKGEDPRVKQFIELITSVFSEESLANNLRAATNHVTVVKVR